MAGQVLGEGTLNRGGEGRVVGGNKLAIRVMSYDRRLVAGEGKTSRSA